MTVGEDIHTSTIALQAPVEEGVELARVIEDDLVRKGQGSGEQDFVECGAKLLVLSLDKMELMEH